MGTALAKRYGLNERQAEFVRLMVEGVDAKEAYALAGYEDSTGTAFYGALQLPQIRNAIGRELAQFLQTRAAPAAVQVLLKILGNANVGERIRTDAAKILLDRSGFAPAPARQDSVLERQLAEMSGDELRWFIDKLEQEMGKVEGELASRSKALTAPDSAPDPASISTDAAELLE